MAINAEQVFREALQLPESQRARLVTELLVTLEPDVPAGRRTDEEWTTEVERRARIALEGGPALPLAEARARVQDRLAGK